MRIYYIYILLLGLISCGLISCEDDVNDWGYNDSKEMLFRPTSFEVGDILPTSVELKFKGASGATKYVFEFSEKDSLQFTNISKTVEIPVDSLYADIEDGKAPTSYTFARWFTDLKGTTPYSVRVKIVNEQKNIESGYMQVYFKTPDEQILTGVSPATNKATISWDTSKEVTHIVYKSSGDVATDTEKTEQITNEQKAKGQVEIPDLASGSSYTISIYNNDAKRGTLNFITLGIKDTDGLTIRIQSDDSANINTILENCVTNGNNIVALVFDGNQVYEIDKITIPTGIDKFYFVGDATSNGTLPELYLNKITMSSPLSAITFQNIDLNARLNSSNYLFDIGNTNCFKTVDFESCIIRNIGRSLVRLNHVDLDIDHIRIKNCIIKSVGVSGYGMVNMGKNIVKLGELSITNSTIMEFGSDRIMQLQGGVSKLFIDKCTFCNYTSGSAEVFRFDKQPGSVTVTNSVFTGNNKGVKINSGKADYSAYLEFYGCYVTSDLEVKTIAFTNATMLDLTSKNLFVDPENGDFRVIEGVRFAGKGKAGDPRWW